MKLMTMKQYSKMSKPSLIRKITKALKKFPKKKLALMCYNITKQSLPTLKPMRRKRLPAPKRRMGKRAKTAYSSYPRRYTNGRVFKKSRKKSRERIKGTPEAKAWGRRMARLRRR